VFDGNVQFGNVSMPLYWLFIIAFTLTVTGVVIVLLNRTKYGMYIRAASRDSEMVSLLGVDNTKVYTGLFAAGAALAGLSGVLIAPLRGVRPVMGAEIIIASFVVVVIGGLGSIGGAILGSVLVGVLTSFTTLWFPELSDVAMFVAMIAVLLLLPEGLMGEEGRVE
jgi:branched-chain amino acid transport system permease protein